MEIKHFFDKDTFTLTYVVYDKKTKDGIVIDPVLDYDPASGKIQLNSFSQVSDFIKKENIHLHYVLETHAHADHLSSSQHFKKIFPNVKTAISKKITEVQSTFKKIYNLSEEFIPDGSHFDKLINDNEEFNAGTIKVKAIPTPGHTPACMSFLIGDSVFTGDALFIEDYGTGRCDFPGGSAKTLYQSINKNLYGLSDDVNVYVGHDYSPNGREMRFQTTIGASKAKNIQLSSETSEEKFIQFREARDKTLNAPRLLFPSLQVNIDAGRLPDKESNGQRYLKMPIFEKFEE